MNLAESIVERLSEAAGPDGATVDPAIIAPHLHEWRGRWDGQTALLLRPRTREAVSRILAICNETHTPIVPQGGNTGLVGGQIPMQGEVLLSLERLTQIRSVSASDNALVAEAGVILMQAQQAADKANRLFPLSLAAEGSCTIGGNLSTNAGGVNVLRYGMMRDLVLGLEVVLADGRVLDLMRGLRKDNSGYDLKQLFIGAEGTLGVITAAMLKLFPKPASYTTVFAGVSGVGAALDLLHRLQDATGGLVTAFELIPRAGLDLVLKHIPGTVDPLPDHRGWMVLIELSNPSAFDSTAALEEALGQAMEDGLVQNGVFAKGGRDRQDFWRLRETLPEAQKKDSFSISNDISVPLSRMADFIADADAMLEKSLPGTRSFAFGHVGDGNLHFVIRAAEGADDALRARRDEMERMLNDLVDHFGGSISAEHGLGQAKNTLIARYKSAAELDAMRALKRAFDPNDILNPGKVVSPE